MHVLLPDLLEAIEQVMVEKQQERLKAKGKADVVATLVAT
jgi:hypothetical protein